MQLVSFTGTFGGQAVGPPLLIAQDATSVAPPRTIGGCGAGRRAGVVGVRSPWET